MRRRKTLPIAADFPCIDDPVWGLGHEAVKQISESLDELERNERCTR